MRYRVFVGSSSEGKSVAKRLVKALKVAAARTEVERRSGLRPLELQCKLWWQEGMFRHGDAILEGLLSAAGTCDFAVLVLTPDDVTNSRGFRVSSPRDNVVYEAGLFVGALGRHRAVLVVVNKDGRKVKVPSDLAGISYESVNERDVGRAARAIVHSVQTHQQLRRTRVFDDLDEAHAAIYDLMDDPEIKSIHHVALSAGRYRVTAAAASFTRRLVAFLESGGNVYFLTHNIGSSPRRLQRARALLAAQRTRRCRGMAEVYDIRAGTVAPEVDGGPNFIICGGRCVFVMEQRESLPHRSVMLVGEESVSTYGEVYRSLRNLAISWDPTFREAGRRERSSKQDAS